MILLHKLFLTAVLIATVPVTTPQQNYWRGYAAATLANHVPVAKIHETPGVKTIPIPKNTGREVTVTIKKAPILPKDVQTTLYGEAIGKLKTGDRALIVFGADWCEPCKRFNNDVLQNEEVNQFLLKKNVILIYHLNVEKEVEVARQINYKVIPYFFITDGKNILKSGNSVFTKEQFLDWLKY